MLLVPVEGLLGDVPLDELGEEVMHEGAVQLVFFRPLHALGQHCSDAFRGGDAGGIGLEVRGGQYVVHAFGQLQDDVVVDAVDGLPDIGQAAAGDGCLHGEPLVPRGNISGLSDGSYGMAPITLVPYHIL